MHACEAERHVGCPVVELEKVDATVRPALPWVVARSHQKTEQDVEAQDVDGGEADERRKIFRFHDAVYGCGRVSVRSGGHGGCKDARAYHAYGTRRAPSPAADLA